MVLVLMYVVFLCWVMSFWIIDGVLGVEKVILMLVILLWMMVFEVLSVSLGDGVWRMVRMLVVWVWLRWLDMGFFD